VRAEGTVITLGRRLGFAEARLTDRNGTLYAEDVALTDIAAQVGTPFYCYSTATFTRHFRLFDEALDGMDHLVCYAMKANSNQAILSLMASLGAGVDVVSGGEYARAKAAGFDGDKIVFSGVGKTREEMRAALTGGIRQFNLESEPEMLVLNEVALELGTVAPVTVRVNPDVDAKPMKKSPPANRKTNSVSRSPARGRSMPISRPCRGCALSASTSISAAS